jgi:hypothetical protein
LVATLPQDDRIRQRRDEAFFAWRYRNPLHAYRFIVARRDGRITGYLVLQRGLSAYADARRINLVDWACESDEVLAALIETAQRVGGITDLVTWRCSDAGTAAVFERLGFLPADLHQAQRGLPCILVRAVQQTLAANGLRLGARPLLDLPNWDLRMAYTSFA